MEILSLAQIAEWAGAEARGVSPERLAGLSARGVGTDTRAFREGELFVALSGERFDGHGFVAGAAASGAVGALVAREVDGLPEGFPQLLVPDVLAGLQRLAAHYRAWLGPRVVGVTGSNGKTTTKEFCAAVLGAGFAVSATRGNLNNHIGVPLTLLSLERAHGVAVVEMGMNHAGEIAPLAAMAAPWAGVITNIGVAHVEHLGSRGAIAREKGALARALPPDGFLAIDAEGDFAGDLAGQTAARVVACGLSRGDLRAEGLRFGPGGSRFSAVDETGRADCLLPVPGEHMVRNALLALAVGRGFGLPLEACAAKLAGASAGSGRLQQRDIRGVRVVDDSYNANPDSMAAAIETVARIEVPGRRVAALGQMNELGDFSLEGHRAVGRAAAGKIDALVAVGPVAAAIAVAAGEAGLADARVAADAEEAAEMLEEMLRPGDLLLVKGSRGARMERVIDAYEKGAATAAAEP